MCFPFQDWCDLVEYVINKFISSPQSASHKVVPMNVSALPMEMRNEQPLITHPKIAPNWTEEELDSLNWYFAQAKCQQQGSGGVVDAIARQFQESGRGKRSSEEIAGQLLAQGMISEEEAGKYYPPKIMEKPQNGGDGEAAVSEVAVIVDQEANPSPACMDDVQFLCQKIGVESPQTIVWLQRVLLECAFIKENVERGIRSNAELPQRFGNEPLVVMEPIALVNICECKEMMK